VRKPESRRSRQTTLVLIASLVLVTALAALIALKASWQEAAYQARILELREENQAQQFHLQRFADRMGALDQQMERLEDFYAKLKIIADLDLQQNPESSVAVGGPQPGDPDGKAAMEMDLKRQVQWMQWELEELELEASVQEQNAYKVEDFLDSQRSLLAATPTIWPVRGWISSTFGLRLSPFNGRLQMHEGLDIGGRPETPVHATADGIVVYTGWKPELGKTVTLDHGYGYVTCYGHLSRIYCHNGQSVKRGTVLGTMGDTGKSTGYHLHYEVKLNGVALNPKNYMLD
jgi:murein DD-endopeptidase MepM/ murein hydrolase activator NlpD